MDFYAMTDQGIGVELGKRIKRLRLRKNYTQQENDSGFAKIIRNKNWLTELLFRSTPLNR